MDINGKKLNPWPGCVGGPTSFAGTRDAGIKYPELMWNDGLSLRYKRILCLVKPFKIKVFSLGT